MLAKLRDRALLQPLVLPSEDAYRGAPKGGTHLLSLLLNLLRELARRREHHRKRPEQPALSLLRRLAPRRGHLPEEGHEEAERLARARLRDAHDVAAGESERERLCLHRRRRLVPTIREEALDASRQWLTPTVLVHAHQLRKVEHRLAVHVGKVSVQLDLVLFAKVVTHIRRRSGLLRSHRRSERAPQRRPFGGIRSSWFGSRRRNERAP